MVMEDARRKPKEQHRVPLNCLVRPDTMQEIRERAVNGKSQGQVIDEAISALYRETGTAYDPHKAAHAAAVATGDAIIDMPESPPQLVRKSVNGEKVVPMPRPFPGPILKPKDRKS